MVVKLNAAKSVRKSPEANCRETPGQKQVGVSAQEGDGCDYIDLPPMLLGRVST